MEDNEVRTSLFVSVGWFVYLTFSRYKVSTCRKALYAGAGAVQVHRKMQQSPGSVQISSEIWTHVLSSRRYTPHTNQSNKHNKTRSCLIGQFTRYSVLIMYTWLWSVYTDKFFLNIVNLKPNLDSNYAFTMDN